MPKLPRPAGRSSLPGLVAGLASATLLLGACSGGGQERSDAADPTPSPSSSSSSAPTEEPSDTAEPAPSNGEQYVALGDSYTAAPLVPSTDTSDGCLRSDGNYPHLLAAELGYELTDVSCVGATTTSMVGVQQTQSGAQPAQFDALGRDTDLVTLGIGGNDVELFSTLFQDCLPLAADDPDGAPCTEKLEGGPDDLLPAVRRVDGLVEAIVTGIRQRAPKAQIVVVDYPQLLPAEGSCEAGALAAGDYAYVREVNAELSRAVVAGAEAADADTIDVLGMSKGRDVCSEDPWVNGIQTDPERALAFHPFAVEQEAVAAAVADLVG
ncbi:SGNH/GDSL hydrolase family protein [Nocardioides sp. AX2bis]|uniref:SGNH/GDSL hydrolase family protein n=1 Tax=Nocardioides sp. AX2bis TaxID=2653157 RepID=UPI0012F2A579|nr:SGNH/GDSL hydrolase family protein [Nocardioides sp. AX2bis]VXB97082.1 putative Lipase 2 [Nocardioides sp. AX2bis]